MCLEMLDTLYFVSITIHEFVDNLQDKRRRHPKCSIRFPAVPAFCLQSNLNFSIPVTSDPTAQCIVKLHRLFATHPS